MTQRLPCTSICIWSHTFQYYTLQNHSLDFQPLIFFHLILSTILFNTTITFNIKFIFSIFSQFLLLRILWLYENNEIEKFLFVLLLLPFYIYAYGMTPICLIICKHIHLNQFYPLFELYHLNNS